MTRFGHLSAFTGLSIAVFIALPAHAGVLPFAASGDAATIQGALDAFRAAVGPLNPNTPGSFGGGRREINWDGVPDTLSSPNPFPGDFFNAATAPRARGALFSTEGSHLEVSAKSGNPTGTPLAFGHLDPSYVTHFGIFTPQRLFAPIDALETTLTFFIPGTVSVPAESKAFGAVFTGVNVDGSTKIVCYDSTDAVVASIAVPAAEGDGGFSFAGVILDGAERIAKVVVTSGSLVLARGNVDDFEYGYDVVAMDDFIYGEPINAACPADLTGDGQVDGADLGIVLSTWGPNPGHPADFDGNGAVDGGDLGELLAVWGGCA